MAKKNQFKSSCVFCGGKSPSDEHVFPQWLGKRLKFPCNQSIQSSRVAEYIDGKLSYYHVVKKSRNHISSKTTRKICKNCNNGWLGRIENDLIPIYEKIINYELSLNQDEQLQLASWAYLLALKWDLMETKISGYRSEHYDEFYQNKIPSRNTKIWIGFSDDDEIECFHRTCIVTNNLNIPLSPNIRSTTLKIGTVVFFVLTDTSDTLEFLGSANTKSPHKLQQIHPYIKTVDDVSTPFSLLKYMEMQTLTKMCGMQHDNELFEMLLGSDYATYAGSIPPLIFSSHDSLALQILRGLADIGLTGPQRD